MAQNIQDNYKYSTSQLSTFLPGTYFERTARPIYALVYLIGFLLFYEVSVILANPDLLNESLYVIQGGVVAFVWVQNLLHFFGFSDRLAWLAIPFVVIIILLILQIVSRQKWQFFFRDFFPMTAECIILAVPLIVLGLLLSRSITAQYVNCSSELSNSSLHPLLLSITTAIGAGIYEELVFRLILICLFMIFFETVLGLNHKKSVVISVLLSALLFSLHHHIVFLNGQLIQAQVFTLPKFVFRVMAGIYFAVIFAARGFGITAGTHVFYDIIVMTILN